MSSASVSNGCITSPAAEVRRQIVPYSMSSGTERCIADWRRSWSASDWREAYVVEMPMKPRRYVCLTSTEWDELQKSVMQVAMCIVFSSWRDSVSMQRTPLIYRVAQKSKPLPNY